MERRYQEVSKFLTWDCQVPLLPKFGVSQVITHLSYDDKIIILAQCMLDIFFLPVFPDCIRSCMLISLHLTPVTCINMKLKLCESEMNTSSVPFISNPGFGLGYLHVCCTCMHGQPLCCFLVRQCCCNHGTVWSCA